MKKATALLLAPTLFGSFLTACTGDSDSLSKGAVDEAEVEAGVTVTLSGSLGTVTIPLETAIDDQVNTDELEAELDGTVSLTVTNDDTLVTFSLSDGELVSSEPTAAGEWTWGANSARDEIQITFYNEIDGVSLRTEGDYSGLFSIATNDFIENVAGAQFEVTVQ